MLVFMMCICSRYANQTTSLRVGVELDIPRSLFKTLDGVMLAILRRTARSGRLYQQQVACPARLEEGRLTRLFSSYLHVQMQIEL